MTFDAVGVFALAFHLLFKSCLSILCLSFEQLKKESQKKIKHNIWAFKLYYNQISWWHAQDIALTLFDFLVV